jgi:transcription antitermination factor NusG
MSQSIHRPPQHWRVFYTMARAEKKCETLLQDRAIDVFLPKVTTLRTWKDRKKKVTEPLFRNYIFAHVDEGERLRVLRTRGIVRCVTFNGQPAIVDADVIEQLQIAQKAPERVSLADFFMPKVGEEVIVTRPPLQGLRGYVLERRGQMDILIQVEAIRQSVRVQVPVDWVERHRRPHAA